MPKSGTGWYFNLTNDLLIAAGHQDARDVRSRFRLHSTLRFHNCNVEKLTPARLALIALPHLAGNTFVVKTHNRPTQALRLLTMAGIVRATYIYRDPRDVAISAFEHGQKILSRGDTHTFAKLDSIETAISVVGGWYLAVWDAWMAFHQAQPDQTLIVRYEDLVADTTGESKRLVDFLDLDVSSQDRRAAIATYQRDEVRVSEEILHFNRGVVGRFESIMSAKELDLCKFHFEGHLQKMGYPEQVSSTSQTLVR